MATYDRFAGVDANYLFPPEVRSAIANDLKVQEKIDQGVGNLSQWVDENVPRNDDPRLSDARPPTSHKHPLADLTGITIDRTVGTRVLIDGLMVHGETPKRDVTSLFASGLAAENTGRLIMYRRGTRAVLELKSVLLLKGSGAITWTSVLPAGWPPHERLTSLAVTRTNSTDRHQAFTLYGPHLWWTSEVAATTSIQSTTTRPTVTVSGQIEWETFGWPASLPGTPA